MSRIVIITEHDLVWALPTWERAVPILERAGYEVIGLWTCPAVLAGLRGYGITYWYLTHFGLIDFVKLGFFAVFSRLHRLFGGLLGRTRPSFKALAKQYGLAYGHCNGPNDPVFVEWLRSVEPDILIIWVGEILKKQVLDIPSLGCINKHASLLPAYKGIFPYIWAYMDAAMQGVSFHRVTESIDDGNTLSQQIVPEQITRSSMIKFYLETYRQYPVLLLEAIDALIKGNSVSSKGLPPSYFGLPDKQDIDKFRKSGGNIVRWADITTVLK
jgi:methionyl-tRNA formyltransferase